MKLLPVEELLSCGAAAAAAKTQHKQVEATPARSVAATDTLQQQQQQHTGHVNNSTRVQQLPWFYVLFTSGSTGTPLGVLGTEQGFINRFTWMQQQQKQPVPLLPDQQPSKPDHHHQQQQQQQQGEQQQQPVPLLPDQKPCEPDHRHQQQQGEQQQHQQQKKQQHVPLLPNQQPCKPDQQQQQQTVPLQPGHVVAFKTSVGFVDHIWELLAPLLSGADMLLLPDTAAAAGSGAGAGTDESRLAQEQQQQQKGTELTRPQALLVLQPEAFVQLLVQHRMTHLVS
jgi:acyl-CoA synthetase (AMP-forming)/AMP-acid ligase II